MARFTVEGARPGKAGTTVKDLGQAADGALQAAGERLAEYFRGAIIENKLVDTHALLESIKPTAVKVSAKDGRYLDVYPQGVRENGERNAAVGYYQEYGVTRVPPRRSISATHWMSNTVDDVAEEIQAIIANGVAEAVESTAWDATIAAIKEIMKILGG